jgi:hypothetical protein
MLLRGILPSRRNAMFAWSIVPCLMAFAGLLWHSILADSLLTIGFVLHYVQDLRLGAVAALPAWYLPLRLRLTTTAVACVLVGAACNGW